MNKKSMKNGRFHLKNFVRFGQFTKIPLSLLVCCTALAGSITKPNVFTAGESISASKMNDNFDLFETRVGKFESAMTPLANGNVGVGTSTPTAKLEVNGDIKASGSYFGGGQAFTYSCTPAAWSYSAANGYSSGWRKFYECTVNFPHAAIVQVGVVGHWSVSSGAWCYMTIGVDVADNTSGGGWQSPCTTSTDCYGAAHTYSTSWENPSFQTPVTVSAGNHTFAVGVKTSGGTCNMNGSRMNFFVVPQ